MAKVVECENAMKEIIEKKGVIDSINHCCFHLFAEMTCKRAL